MIYVWSGPKSSPAKKSKGSAVAEIFKNHERNGHATIVKVDGSDDAAFWTALGGGSAKDIQDKWALGTDEYPFLISVVYISSLIFVYRCRKTFGYRYEVVPCKYRIW